MKNFRPQEVSIASLTILLTLAAAPPLIKIHPVLAQSSTPAVSPSAIVVPNGTTVKIDGSSSLTTINEALKQRFEQQFTGTKVELRYGEPDSAIQALLDGKVDLVAIGRPLTADEAAKGLVLVPVARNKIAIIVGAGNSFKKSLTLTQFAKIFRGEITDWSKLGRSAGPIRVIDRPDTSDTRQAFQNYPVFQKAPFQAGENAVKLSEDNTEAVIKGLGTNGIGYAIADQVTGKPGIRIVAMHNTLPINAKYPFSQPLGYVYRGPEPTPGIKAFLDYAIAPENQPMIEQARAAEATASPPAEPASGEPASPDQAFAPPADSLNTLSTPVPWWGWWLSIPLLSGLLWWLLKRRGAETVAPTGTVTTVSPPIGVPEVPLGEGLSRNEIAATPSFSSRSGDASDVGEASLAGAAGATAVGKALSGDRAVPDYTAVDHAAINHAAIDRLAVKEESRMILVPRTAEDGYAYWEIPGSAKAELRRQGGEKLALRLYDVTGGIDLDRHPPHGFQQFDADEWAQDQHVPISVSDRDYIVELGYVTNSDYWLKLVRSKPVHVPSQFQSTFPNG
jgi:phosphate transport system substrate-binding protein